MVKESIAIIPARGGSRRIPRKNVIEFRGRPMISWTIEAAIESGTFSRVIVSTDDEEIATVASTAGAEVPFLREVHAGDHAPVSRATCSALLQAESHWNSHFDPVVQLMANCPLRRADHIQEAMAAFTRQEREYQISACRFGWMNPWWAATIDERGHPEPLFPDARKKRSQDLPTLVFPSGAIWVARRDSLLESRDFYGPGFAFEEMPWTAGVDIDDWDDFDFALSVAEVLTRRAESSLPPPRPQDG